MTTRKRTKTVCILMAQFVLLCMLASCAAWTPTFISSGIGGFQFYQAGVLREVYNVPMDKAYIAAIGTNVSLGLEVTHVEHGEGLRIVKSEDVRSKIKITVILEETNDGHYVKASFQSLKHYVVPDRAYTMVVMKEFDACLFKGEKTARNESNRGGV